MKKLQRKLIEIVFFSVAAVFLIVLAVLYFTLGCYNQYQADGMTELISLNGGIVPQFEEYNKQNSENKIPQQIILYEESQFRTRYFIVYLDEEMKPVNVNIEHIAAIDQSAAFDMAEEAVLRSCTTGYIDNYRFRITANGDTTLVIFLDCYESLSFRKVVSTIIIFTAVLITILVTVIFTIFSKRVVRPFEENAQKQKQFITDASHELKTPLSIISANAEVLEFKNGSNEWIKNIISQTKRMNKLIGDLLALARLDEIGSNFAMEAVNFSELVSETADSFQEVISQKNVNLQIGIADHIVLNGNPEQLKQLVSALVENAVKYVCHGGIIQIKLARTGTYAVFKIFNTAALEGSIDCNRLFDRFYRLDSSRSSETGGYGIGLSIASKIASQYNGGLSAKQSKDGICFTATISCNLKA